MILITYILFASWSWRNAAARAPILSTPSCIDSCHPAEHPPCPDPASVAHEPACPDHPVRRERHACVRRRTRRRRTRRRFHFHTRADGRARTPGDQRQRIGNRRSDGRLSAAHHEHRGRRQPFDQGDSAIGRGGQQQRDAGPAGAHARRRARQHQRRHANEHARRHARRVHQTRLRVEQRRLRARRRRAHAGAAQLPGDDRPRRSAGWRRCSTGCRIRAA